MRDGGVPVILAWKAPGHASATLRTTITNSGDMRSMRHGETHHTLFHTAVRDTLPSLMSCPCRTTSDMATSESA